MNEGGLVFGGSGQNMCSCKQKKSLTPSPSKFYPLPGQGQLKVSFMSVKVTKDGVWGIWRDANWRFDLSVNGEVRSVNLDVNEDDPPYPVKYNFIVDVSAPGANLTVQVG